MIVVKVVVDVLYCTSLCVCGVMEMCSSIALQELHKVRQKWCTMSEVRKYRADHVSSGMCVSHAVRSVECRCLKTV